MCRELWPGNTADVETLVPVMQRLRNRCGSGDVCVVADWGMISKETIREIETGKGIRYISGVRMRRQKEGKEDILGRGGRYEEAYPKRMESKAPSPLKVKNVVVNEGGQKREVLCEQRNGINAQRPVDMRTIASLKHMQGLNKEEMHLIS